MRLRLRSTTGGVGLAAFLVIFYSASLIFLVVVSGFVTLPQPQRRSCTSADVHVVSRNGRRCSVRRAPRSPEGCSSAITTAAAGVRLEHDAAPGLGKHDEDAVLSSRQAVELAVERLVPLFSEVDAHTQRCGE